MQAQSPLSLVPRSPSPVPNKGPPSPTLISGRAASPTPFQGMRPPSPSLIEKRSSGSAPSTLSQPKNVAMPPSLESARLSPSKQAPAPTLMSSEEIKRTSSAPPKIHIGLARTMSPHHASQLSPMKIPSSPMRSTAELRPQTPTGTQPPFPLMQTKPSQNNDAIPNRPTEQAIRGPPARPYVPAQIHEPVAVKPSAAPDPLTWSVVENAQLPAQRLVGLHIRPIVGLRVALSQQGEKALANQSLGPQLTRGKPGFISRIHEEGDACMVLWDAARTEEGGESGWYRIGAYGQYLLHMTETSNSDDEISMRALKIQEHTEDVCELGF